MRALDGRWPVQWLVVAADDLNARAHLRSMVAGLARADLPVVLWYPAGLPGPDEPELAWVDHLVVDSRSAASEDSIRHLLEIADRLPITDLAWLELVPWRELLAGLFEGPVFAPFLRDLRRVRVEGDAASGRLLAGWLLSRLGVARRVTEVAGADRVAIEILAQHDRRQGRFSVTWSAQAALVDVRAAIVGGPSHHRRWWPHERIGPRLLGRALVHLDADRLYVEALSAAITLD
jgi:glucose-6-phosphate dehydrogenase assembly protein OpcA